MEKKYFTSFLRLTVFLWRILLLDVLLKEGYPASGSAFLYPAPGPQ